MNLTQSLMVCGVFLTLTNGVVSAQTTATKTAKVYTVADAHLDTQWNWDVQTTIKEDADRGFIKRNTYYIAPIKTNYFFLDNSFFQKNYPAKIAGFLLLLKAICLNNTDTIQ